MLRQRLPAHAASARDLDRVALPEALGDGAEAAASGLSPRQADAEASVGASAPVVPLYGHCGGAGVLWGMEMTGTMFHGEREKRT